MKLVIPLYHSANYSKNREYNEMWFNSTKSFLNNKLKIDRIIFVKEALVAFGFEVRRIPLCTARKYWEYKDGRNKVRVSLKDKRIRTGKNTYHLYQVIEFNVKDN